MKFMVIKDGDGKEEFPLKITITIENKDDLMCFWHRINIGSSILLPAYLKEMKASIGSVDSMSNKNNLWGILDKKREKLGIKYK